MIGQQLYKKWNFTKNEIVQKKWNCKKKKNVKKNEILYKKNEIVKKMKLYKIWSATTTVFMLFCSSCLDITHFPL